VRRLLRITLDTMHGGRPLAIVRLEDREEESDPSTEVNDQPERTASARGITEEARLAV
jgi:hypothetical protein